MFLILISLKTGFYIGICTLLLINMFIAMLTSTLDRVYNSARANFLLLRAQRLINNEHSSSIRRRKHLLRLRKPYEETVNVVSQMHENKDAHLQELLHSARRARGDLVTLNHRYDELKEKMVSSTSREPILACLDNRLWSQCFNLRANKWESSKEVVSTRLVCFRDQFHPWSMLKHCKPIDPKSTPLAKTCTSSNR